MPFCYYAKLLSENSVLPVEICDHILSFSSLIIPTSLNKENAPIGWFFYRKRYKLISEIQYESELDICRKCGEWNNNCICSNS